MSDISWSIYKFNYNSYCLNQYNLLNVHSKQIYYKTFILGEQILLMNFVFIHLCFSIKVSVFSNILYKVVKNSILFMPLLRKLFLDNLLIGYLYQTKSVFITWQPQSKFINVNIYMYSCIVRFHIKSIQRYWIGCHPGLPT